MQLFARSASRTFFGRNIWHVLLDESWTTLEPSWRAIVCRVKVANSALYIQVGRALATSKGFAAGDRPPSHRSHFRNTPSEPRARTRQQRVCRSRERIIWLHLSQRNSVSTSRLAQIEVNLPAEIDWLNGCCIRNIVLQPDHRICFSLKWAFVLMLSTMLSWTSRDSNRLGCRFAQLVLQDDLAASLLESLARRAPYDWGSKAPTGRRPSPRSVTGSATGCGF